MMRTTALGTGGPVSSVQGLGCMGMSDFYVGAGADRTESLATLGHALDIGVTHWDTSDMYGTGENERLLGAFFRGGRRDEVLLATKFGIDRNPEEGARGIRGDAEYVRRACDASLARLGVETIDLYYMHRRDTEVPIEETVGAMAELVAAGKVRHLGLSEVTAKEIHAAAAVHPIAAIQAEWSLFARDIEESVVPAAREVGAAVVPYSPLGRGFLSARYASFAELPEDDTRRLQPRFNGENAEANATLLVPLREVAGKRGATPAQIALAWIQQRAEVWDMPVVPIPGTTKRTRLDENAAAVDIVLTDDELALLDPISAQVAGERYHVMTHTYVGPGRE
ncbi:aldo/keto reductase [Yinghuangia soli]|uniref:Aldo/keto reductase n=1 Tax=Yinghuangia soli TaxID=2908204 RepID=A0AA41TZ62_9ACTN|nr:aldo/keto reductase [Yinghuangia soli]MCF2528508.1 aldo/keto reductase [Yinghuangia soli]